MREKLRSKFSQPHYLQDNYTKLYHLRKETKSVDEYTCEFERLIMTCDLKEISRIKIKSLLGTGGLVNCPSQML